MVASDEVFDTFGWSMLEWIGTVGGRFFTGEVFVAEQERPAWFDRALKMAPEYGDVEVEGCKIHFGVWGAVGKPGIVMLHGSNAHLHWWRFTAPFLADQFRVVSMDLSGHGDSGWREAYSGEIFAKEVAAVCEAAQLGEMPFVVAHSFGGFVALEAGYQFGDRLGGIIFADFTVMPPENYNEWGRELERRGGQPARPTRVYEDFDTALGRFRLLPDQPCNYPWVIEYMGRQSLREVAGGWTWKFDPSLFDHLEMGSSQRDKFVSLPCRTAIVLGEDSDDEAADGAPYINEITNGLLPMFAIPGTHHHFMFDEPMATVAAIKGILLVWRREDHAEALSVSLHAVIRAEE